MSENLLLTIGGSVILLLVSIIGFFLRYVLSEKDKKIEKFSDIETKYNTEFSELKREVTFLKADKSVLAKDIEDSRKELNVALSTIKNMTNVYEKIERHLDKSNSIHEDMRIILDRLIR